MWLLFHLLELAPPDQVLDVEIQFSSGLLFGLLDVSKVLISGLPVWGALLKAICKGLEYLVCILVFIPSSCSFKVSHLSDASWPPKNRMCVTLSSLGVWAMVKYWLSLLVKNVQLASLSSNCQFMWGRISGGSAGIPATAMAPSSVFIKWHFGRVWLSWNEKCFWEADYWLKWLVAWYTLGRDCTVPSCKTAKGWDQLAHRWIALITLGGCAGLASWDWRRLTRKDLSWWHLLCLATMTIWEGVWLYYWVALNLELTAQHRNLATGLFGSDLALGWLWESLGWSGLITPGRTNQFSQYKWQIQVNGPDN